VSRTTLSQVVATFLSRLKNVKGTSKGWSALCPAHDDHDNSLSIAEGDDGRVLLKCFAGCEVKSIAGAISMTPADLFTPRRSPGNRRRRIVSTYDYKDVAGNLLYQVVRFAPKGFKQRRPDGTGGWIWNLDGVERVLYRLPDLLAASPEEPVYIVEGEKDVDRLRLAGLVATTNPGGAGKWRPEYNQYFKDRHVVLPPDNDAPGRAHAEEVAAALAGVSASTRILVLPDLAPKGDVSDWFDAGGTTEKLQALVDNQAEWTPPADSLKADPIATKGRASHADMLMCLVEEQAVELFHDPTGGSWARMTVGDHREIWKCDSKIFERWLARLVWEKEKKVPDPHAIKAALNVIAAKARFDGAERTLHNRVAHYEGAFWYDLTDPKWRAVRITAGGWDIVTDVPILFRRYAHHRPQVDPLRGGDPRRLLEFINVKEPQQQLLLEIYAISCLVPDIPHVAPILHGPQGATKTTLLRVMRRLIDPSVTETLSLPHDREQLVQQLAHHWAPYYDNLTGMHDWISDALCRAITGEGSSKREFYTDDDDIIYSFRVCLGFNGINVAAHKPDLLDRALLIGLEEVPRAQRRPEAEFWQAFEEARPAIFGGMLDALSRALKLRPGVKVNNLPRMADFTLWGCAIAEALERSKDEFLNAYHANLMDRNDEVTAANPVAAMVLTFMEDRDSWSGSASALLTELDRLAQHHRVDMRTQSWPKAAHILGRRLNEIRPNLTTAGIQLTRDRRGAGRHLTLQKSSESSVINVTYDTTSNRSGEHRDATADATPGSRNLASPTNPSADGPHDGCDASDAAFPKAESLVDRARGTREEFDL